MKPVIMKRRVCISLLILVLILSAAGCNKKPDVPLQISEITGESDIQNNKYAIIEIEDFGTLKFKLFDKYAPLETDAFCNLAYRGFFDGKPVYMIIKDYCFFAGDKNSGERINSSEKDEEKDKKDVFLYPLRGALCLTNGNGSDGYVSGNFSIIETSSSFLSELEELLKYKKVTLSEYIKQAYGTDVDDETLNIFKKYGGSPWLYGHCRVFGQLVEGEDLLDRICGMEVSDDANFSPIENIVIKKVQIQ
ncbi:MAG: peptidylprolyl isomerase [Lachnospiraceae bacterium]|nr:peptidylprolyl isomerase [Lachnospiraceae bacterium]